MEWSNVFLCQLSVKSSPTNASICRRYSPPIGKKNDLSVDIASHYK